MKYDRLKHHRRSIRLKGFDYRTAGAYFVTICVQGGRCLLGDIVDGEMEPNAAGRMVHREWLALADRLPTIELDAFVIMPNHIHGIIIIHDPPVRAGLVPAPDPAPAQKERAPLVGAPTGRECDRPALGQIVGAFKSITTNQYIQSVRESDWRAFHSRFWKRNYYEHIIRNERSFTAIQKYIGNNPASWPEDQLHPANPKHKHFVE